MCMMLRFFMSVVSAIKEHISSHEVVAYNATITCTRLCTSQMRGFHKQLSKLHSR